VREKLKLSVDVILDPKAIDNSEDAVNKYTPFYSIEQMRYCILVQALPCVCAFEFITYAIKSPCIC